MIATAQLIAALETRVRELALFDRVQLSWEPDLAASLEEFRILERSVCLVVPGGEDWTHELEGDEPVFSSLRQEFSLLVSDRDLGTPGRGAAALRDAGEAGAVAAKDRLMRELLFDNLGIDGLLVLIRSADPISLRFDDPSARGRLAWAIELEIRATEPEE
ncbi:MAG: hypothetical protein IT577_23730 [Verrucomicrobiae bacterium]|nr:hypothetical protein [Verrucomicrobiae bacterium]